jgi:hypothetical protein
MAEEQIKIRIQADAADFKVIMDAVNTKLAEFGKTATVVAGNVKIVQKDLDNTANSFTKVGNAAQASGEKIKTANQGYTHLALVLQDLPFGFRGIQNNLPALVGDIAGAAGPIYLLSSALIAFTTAYEKQITEFIYGISETDAAQQKLNATIGDSIGHSKAEIASNESLLIIINDITKSTKERKDALDLLKEKYKGNIDLQKTDITDGQKLIEITNNISSALLRKARAEAFSKLIAEEETNLYKLQNERGEQVVKNLGFMGTAYALIKGSGNAATTSMNLVNDAFDSQSKSIKDTEGRIKLFTDKLNENTLAQIKNRDEQTLDTKSGKKDKKKAYGKDDYAGFLSDTKEYYDNQINLAEGNKEQQIKILTEEWSTFETLLSLKKVDLQDYEKIASEIYKKIFDLQVSLDKEADRVRSSFTSAYKSELKQQESDFKEFYNNRMNLATGDSNQQKQILLDERAQLEEGLALNLFSRKEYDKEVAENAKKTAEVTAKIAKESMDSLMKIGNGIMNAIGPSMDMLLDKGASIGEVLSKAFQDLIKTLIKVIITAAIAVLLISILFPSVLKNAGGALKLFGGLIGQASGIGGLIGGGNNNTSSSGGVNASQGLGAIGSVQASNNTANSGQFVLRGSDLVLALNRSESSLNLRRGS